MKDLSVFAQLFSVPQDKVPYARAPPSVDYRWQYGEDEGSGVELGERKATFPGHWLVTGAAYLSLLQPAC